MKVVRSIGAAVSRRALRAPRSGPFRQPALSRNYKRRHDWLFDPFVDRQLNSRRQNFKAKLPFNCKSRDGHLIRGQREQEDSQGVSPTKVCDPEGGRNSGDREKKKLPHASR